jgi:secreted trypsin-like serine protease
MAEMKLINLRSALANGFTLQATSNPGGGRGGSCFGDSGGPVFLGGAKSNLIVSVNSFVHSWCAGNNFSYRVDTRAAQEWILDTVPEREVDDIQIVEPHGKTKSEQHKGGKGKGHHRR